MSSLAAKRIDYYPTEKDIHELLKKTNLPMSFINDFTRDYAAVKRNTQNADGTIDNVNERLTIAEAEIVAIEIRVTANEAAIVALDVRLTTAEGEIETLRIDLDQLRSEFDAHVAATEAHGASGDIVGRLNYPVIDPDPLLSKAGVVFTALQVANALPSAITPPSAVAAAPAAYSQAYAQSQTDAINALSTQLDQLKTDHNNAVTQINLLMANMRVAKQLETP